MGRERGMFSKRRISGRGGTTFQKEVSQGGLKGQGRRGEGIAVERKGGEKGTYIPKNHQRKQQTT